MTQENSSASATENSVRDSFTGVVQMLFDSVEATIAREHAELALFKQRSKLVLDYLPLAVDLARKNRPADARGPLKVCLYIVWDGEYDGALAVPKESSPETDIAKLQGTGKRIHDMLKAAGMRPTLGWDKRFSRANGQTNNVLCHFIEVDPAVYQ